MSTSRNHQKTENSAQQQILRTSPLQADITLAIIVPCFNEEATVTTVVKRFAKAAPTAAIFVVDNASTDNTAKNAKEAGATVLTQTLPGKAHAIRHAFANIDADIYVMVDGDDTYDADIVRLMVDNLISRQLDMVVGKRSNAPTAAYRFGHQIGNKVFNAFFRMMFGGNFQDIFSGYRVFSRRFVKSFPIQSRGFEIETELSFHALSLRMQVVEIDTKYKERPVGSTSKLNTYVDGIRIVSTMIQLMRYNKPMLFYGCFAMGFGAVSIFLGLPIVWHFFETGLVPKFPSLIVSVGFLILAAISFMCALILDAMLRFQNEARMLAYIQSSGPDVQKIKPPA